MSLISNEGVITELDNGKNFTYILNKSELFSKTDYKVLQSQSEEVFVKCVEQRYNGKMSLYYMADPFKSIESLYVSLSPEVFLGIIGNLIDEILKIEKNGFLSCRNIDLSPNKIFINDNDMTLRLVYIPIQNNLTGIDLELEKNIRQDIFRLIESYSASSNDKVIQLSKNFLDETETIESLHKLFESIKLEIEQAELISNIKLKLISQDSVHNLELVVDKDVYIIGKNIAVVDGAITFNRAISRTHCKIVREGDIYYIVDLGSSNGTFVNGTQVHPNVSHRIEKMDVVRLANTDFIVEF